MTAATFWSRFTPGNLLTVALVCGSVLIASQRTTARLDVLEHRIAELERVETRDFAELKATVGELSASLSVCRESLARLQQDVAWLREHLR